MRPVRRSVVVLIAALALTGCVPEGEAPGAPASAADPVPSTSASPSTPPSASPSTPPSTSPSTPPSEAPDTSGLVLPESCDALVPLAWIRSAFSSSFESIPFAAGGGGPTAVDFAARGGLACMWGIPSSDAGITLFVAERATPTDAAQVAEWQAAGYELGPHFLDACWLELVSGEIGEMVAVYALVEGYELQAQGFGVEVDPYLSLIRQATDSMGYL